MIYLLCFVTVLLKTVINHYLIILCREFLKKETMLPLTLHHWCRSLWIIFYFHFLYPLFLAHFWHCQQLFWHSYLIPVKQYLFYICFLFFTITFVTYNLHKIALSVEFFITCCDTSINYDMFWNHILKWATVSLQDATPNT